MTETNVWVAVLVAKCQGSQPITHEYLVPSLSFNVSMSSGNSNLNLASMTSNFDLGFRQFDGTAAQSLRSFETWYCKKKMLINFNIITRNYCLNKTILIFAVAFLLSDSIFDTLQDVRHWSKILRCTIPTPLPLTNLELKIIAIQCYCLMKLLYHISQSSKSIHISNRVCFHSITTDPRVHAISWGWRSKYRTSLYSDEFEFSFFSSPEPKAHKMSL